jgi:FKBP-type peptidyl-prolyl cis-trans isomerase (trigger factor)
MGYTIPIEIYEKFEEKLGKEAASVVVKALEMSIREAIKEGKRDLKSEITEELKKELATKYDLKLVETELRKDIDLLRQEMHKEIGLVKKEIDLVRKDMKIITIIILAAMIFLNQNSLEFLARLFGLIK